MGKPFLAGIALLANQIAMEHAMVTKAVAIEITKHDLKTRTGLYLDSFHIEEVGPASVAVSNTAQYATILEQGQKPHKISPRDPAGALRFIWENPPVAPNFPPFHIYRSVNHPGAKAYQILNQAMRAVVKKSK